MFYSIAVNCLELSQDFMPQLKDLGWYKRLNDVKYVVQFIDTDIVREKGVVGYPSGYDSTSPVGGSTSEGNSNCLRR